MTLPMTDIEAALVEALRGLPGGYMETWPAEPLAQAILAHPAMQAIARQAAIGAAVERLPASVSIRREPTGDEYEWAVVPNVKGYHAGYGRTLPEAIAAALGEDR